MKTISMTLGLLLVSSLSLADTYKCKFEVIQNPHLNSVLSETFELDISKLDDLESKAFDFQALPGTVVKKTSVQFFRTPKDVTGNPSTIVKWSFQDGAGKELNQVYSTYDFGKSQIYLSYDTPEYGYSVVCDK